MIIPMNDDNKTLKHGLLTVKEVAELINCKPSTVYAWAKCGEIPCYKIGGLLRFDQMEIEEWIRQSKVSVTNVPEIRAKHIACRDIYDIQQTHIEHEG
jgi:excisionase family DNA binding protein